MDRASVAEWILTRVTDPARASELVGDQLETEPQASFVRFWGLVGGHIIKFSWRMGLGLLCGGYVGVWSWLPIALIWQRTVHPAPSLPMIWFMGFSMLLWCMAAFSLVRFGIRSEMFRLSFAAAFLGSAGATLLRLPNSGPLLIIASVGLAGLFMTNQTRREALTIFSVTIASAWLVGFWVIRLQVVSRSQSKWPLLLGVVVIPLVEGLLASRLHYFFGRNKRQAFASRAA